MSEIQPSSFPPYEGRPSYIPAQRNLKEAAETLYKTITYTNLSDLKKYASSLFYLAVIMHLDESEILSKEEKSSLYEKVQSIEDRIHESSLKLGDAEGALKSLLDHLCDKHPKVKVLTLLVELERPLCMEAPSDSETLSQEEFHQILSTYKEKLHLPLTSLEITQIDRDIQEVKQLLEKEPNKVKEAGQLLLEKSLRLR